MSETTPLLLVGEVFVDYTLTATNLENKLRFGGIIHAARGLWAASIRYSVAVVCPKYLIEQAQNYLKAFGCEEVIWLGEILGTPNVIAIQDATETADQGYDQLLRDEKIVELKPITNELKTYSNALIFPGSFDLDKIRKFLSANAKISFDIAYDLKQIEDLRSYKNDIEFLITSTSSELFMMTGHSDFTKFIHKLKELGPKFILLKENRGGSRLVDVERDEVHNIPALLGTTVNSVGVGDVYSAVLVGINSPSVIESGWRAVRAATCYSQTTFPDDFKRDLQRSFDLSIAEMQALGGTFLPWHSRNEISIYFAAPDFDRISKNELDEAISALKYHNFKLRRPIIENGELPKDSPLSKLKQTYFKDVELIKECELVFAVPLDRDPGTLVEIGMAIAMGKPVITYDPRRENKNTMVMSGSDLYSEKLELCVTGVFECLSKNWRHKNA